MIAFVRDCNTAPFLLEAAEACQCYFFENWLMKLKCPILLKPLDTMIQESYWSFYPAEPFRITRYTMRHPVLVAIKIRFWNTFLPFSWLISWESTNWPSSKPNTRFAKTIKMIKFVKICLVIFANKLNSVDIRKIYRYLIFIL